MNLPQERQAIVDKLLELDARIDHTRFFATVESGASEFALGNPYAFLIACCLDRQTPSEVIWTIPFWLLRRWGHLDPHRIHSMSEKEVADAFQALPRRPRFINDAPSTILELTRIVVNECGGDARALWLNRNANDFQKTLARVHGVGPGIASMAVQLVIRAFPEELNAGKMNRLDIKPDTHTRRVLYRLGVAKTCSDADAIRAARALYSEHPGRLDAALWWIGHEWCGAGTPNCKECVLAKLCERTGA